MPVGTDENGNFFYYERPFIIEGEVAAALLYDIHERVWTPEEVAEKKKYADECIAVYEKSRLKRGT